MPNGGPSVALCLCSTQAGLDKQQRADGLNIGLAPDGGDFTDAQIPAVLAHFLPPDAVHVRDFTDPDVGLVQVYQSSDLAATFPASSFYDSNGQVSVPPGTVSAACHRPGAPGCSVILGI